MEEQDKLANFISLLDERISTQNKIIEKLETLIKGIVVTHHRKCPNKQFVKISKLGESFSVGVLSKEDLAEEELHVSYMENYLPHIIALLM
ncbi:hypothetical protein [Tidjanibacter massiliensis]|uniref:hypothetical protein n=1 Tax=Tidjanibacter massiliensis TaxID=1871003 RepID=UPI00214CF18F|nr:hypothetical protein [Tidjanibacter massiliensis]